MVTDLAAGGRAEWAEDWEVMGENVDCAELGRSGMALAAAAARLCAAIASRTEERPLKVGLELLVLETDDASEDAFGLFWSFSSNCFDFASSVAMILSQVSAVDKNVRRCLRFSTSWPNLSKSPESSSRVFPNFGIRIS